VSELVGKLLHALNSPRRENIKAAAAWGFLLTFGALHHTTTLGTPFMNIYVTRAANEVRSIRFLVRCISQN
jgi:hypothetical protein